MRNFIKQKLHEHLSEVGVTTSSLLEGVLNKKTLEKYITIGMDTSFDDRGSAINHLNKILGGLDKLKDVVTLYRVVFVNNPKEIDTRLIGSHYVIDKRELERTHQQKSHVGGGNPYMLTVTAPKNLIDYDTTISTNMKFPHETELTLKNKGVGAKIVDVEPFETGNEEDLLGTPSDMEGIYN